MNKITITQGNITRDMTVGDIATLKQALGVQEKELASCGNCGFWREGVCLRYPPAVISYVGTETTGSNGEYRDSIVTSGETHWPDTHKSDWCGEHKYKSE